MNDQTPEPSTDERLLKFATALGDALFDFSIAIGRAVDIIRPELAPAVSRDIAPIVPVPDLLGNLRASLSCPKHNIDAGGTCHACGYNSDVARSRAGYDYGDVPSFEQCPKAVPNGSLSAAERCTLEAGHDGPCEL